MKEPWFFATELLRDLPSISTGIPAGLPRTLEEYLLLFDGAAPEQLVGEATALYLWSRFAARGIAQVQPAARIIAVFREPASFLRSLHLELVQQHQEPEQDLRRALSAEDPRRQGDYVSPSAWYWQQVVLYSDYVRYVEQLRRYQELFPPEQILVLIYDDFRDDNEGVMRAVQRFLGVDDTHPIETAESNPSVRVRSMRLNNLLRALSTGAGPVSRPIRSGIVAVVPERLRGRALRATQHRLLYTEPEPADERLMIELRHRYEPEVIALSEHLGRDLVRLWGYDKLG
jgi:hypothetical protein